MTDSGTRLVAGNSVQPTGSDPVGRQLSRPTGPNRSLIMALLLTPVGLLLAILGIGLTFNVLSLRAWVARRVPFLASVVDSMRSSLEKSDAQLIEGLVGGIGLVLLAGTLAIVVIGIGRWRPTSATARLGRRGLTGLFSLAIVGLLLLAVALPMLANNVPPGLRTLVVGLRQLVGGLLRVMGIG